MNWKTQGINRKHKRKRVYYMKDNADEEKELEEIFPIKIPLFNNSFNSKKGTIENNKIYFNDDITSESIDELSSNLRSVEQKLLNIENKYSLESKIPIYLYLKTNGGDVHAALSAVDCISSIKSPVYTIVNGYVASAGTLLSLSGDKRFIQPNAYMLFHQISSGCWGKMAEIDDEYTNLKKLSKHLVDFYVDKTKLKRTQLNSLLKSDISWNAKECIKKGFADFLYLN